MREASPAELADAVSYYRASGDELAVWCPDDIYIEEPMGLVEAYLAACSRHGVEVLEREAALSVTMSAGRVADAAVYARLGAA